MNQPSKYLYLAVKSNHMLRRDCCFSKISDMQIDVFCSTERQCAIQAQYFKAANSTTPNTQDLFSN